MYNLTYLHLTKKGGVDPTKKDIFSMAIYFLFVNKGKIHLLGINFGLKHAIFLVLFPKLSD